MHHNILNSYLNAEDHFEALFMKCIRSEYRKEASFITDMHQDHALMKCGDKDLERHYLEVDNLVPLHPHNPCEFDGIVFSGVEIWGKMHNYCIVEFNLELTRVVNFCSYY